MKTTRVFTLFALLLVVTSMTTLTSCKKMLPEQVTVRGQVTHEDGQPFEGVCVGLHNNPSVSGWQSVGKWYTDENGYYEIVFEPDSPSSSYSLTFEYKTEDYRYSYDCYVSIWKAKQEIDVVLKKWD